MEARFIDIHTHRKAGTAGILAVRNLFAGEVNDELISGNQFFSLGFHPWEIKPGQKASKMFEGIKKLLSAKGVVMVGETGLDKAIQAPFDLQQELFEMHIEASEKLQKPLLIHCVRAFSDLLAMKKILKPNMPWIIHGFRSNSQILEQLLNKGIYISFGQSLLQDEEKFRKLLLLVPYDLLLFETDDSDLEIELIYRKAAGLLTIEVDELKERVFHNAKLLLPL